MSCDNQEMNESCNGTVKEHRNIWTPNDEAMNYTIGDLYDLLLSVLMTRRKITLMDRVTQAEIDAHMSLYMELDDDGRTSDLYCKAGRSNKFEEIYRFQFYPECYYCRVLPYNAKGELDDGSERLSSLLHYKSKISETHLADTTDSFNTAIMHYFMNAIHWWRTMN